MLTGESINNGESIGVSLSDMIVGPETYINNSNNLITFLALRVYKSKHFSHPCHLKMRKRKQPNRQTQNQRHQLQSHNRRSMYLSIWSLCYTSSSLVSNNNSVLHLVINKTVHLFTERMTFSAVYTMTRLRSELSC